MEDISFRENMSEAIVQFCGLSSSHLEFCSITRCVHSIIYFFLIWKSKYFIDKEANSNIMFRPYNCVDWTNSRAYFHNNQSAEYSIENNEKHSGCNCTLNCSEARNIYHTKLMLSRLTGSDF